MNKETEARIIVISPSSDLEPSALYRHMMSQDLPLKMKETCFGLIIEGEKKAVGMALDLVRDLDEYGIFSKVRAYPPGDLRICRAERGGGPRPGFLLQEFEQEMLPMIGAGLESLEEEEREVPTELPKRKKVHARVIEKLID